MNRFEGGVNTGTSPRDIAPNEFSEAIDVGLDSVGTIRAPFKADSSPYNSPGNLTGVTPNPGYNFHAFTADHDNGAYDPAELIAEGNLFTLGEWAVTGEWYKDAITGGGEGLVFNNGGGAPDQSGTSEIGLATQTNYNTGSAGAGQMLAPGVNSILYRFQYYLDLTLSSGIVPDYFRLSITNDFASTTTVLHQTGSSGANIVGSFTTGVHTVTFTSASDAASAGADFVLKAETDYGGSATTQGKFAIQSMSLVPTASTSDGDSYLLATDEDHTSLKTFIYQYSDDVWGGDHLQLAATGVTGVGSTGAKPVYYSADGNLRFNDGLHTNGTNTVGKWYGYLQRTRFKGTTGEYSHDNWWNTNQEIKAPTIGDTQTSDTHTAGGLSIRPSFSGSGGTWENVAHEFAYSYIYDENQESLLKTYSTAITPGSGTVLAYCKSLAKHVNNPGTTWHLDNRVTGSNIYYRIKNGDDANWYFLFYVDYSLGMSRSPKFLSNSDAYIAWSGGPSQFTADFTTDIDDPPELFTYSTLAGFDQDVTSLYAKYTTATVAKRRTYIGNISYTDSNGVLVTKNDGIIKSPVNKFDTFIPEYLIEATVGDGDEIVKLEEYGDRLLQFKKKKLQIINISQEIEFLEESYMHKGVNHPNAVVRTPMGVAWVNEYGVYFFDGQKMHDLFIKDNVRVISKTEDMALHSNTAWNDFYTVNSLIGYSPKSDELIVSRTCASSSDTGDCYIYNLITKAWTFGKASLGGQETSNFVIDPNNDMIYMKEVTNDVEIYRYSVEARDTGSAFGLKTKDFDFGNPASLKKVYKVYITYKGNGASVAINYGVNGSSDNTGTFYEIDANGDSTKLVNTDGAGANYCLHLAGNLTEFISAELVPSTTLSTNNINSFHLVFNGAVPAGFVINDISIVYREKRIK